MLQGKRATVYHQIGGARKAELESYGALFVDEPLVIDGHLMTSTGPGTGIELALKLLEPRYLVSGVGGLSALGA